MQIKKFKANDMAQAFRLIKKEFGPDAVILSAKSMAGQGTAFSSRKKTGVIVTAAIDNYNSLMTEEKMIRKKDNLLSQNISKKKIPDKKSKISDLFKRVNATLNNDKDIIFKEHDESAREGEKKILFNRLLESGVNEEIVQKLIDSIPQKEMAVKLLSKRDPNECLIGTLEECGVSVKPVAFKPGTQKVICFAGPSGVGKTTTIAKVAAYYTRKKQVNVGIISLADCKVGAVEQISIFAKIIDLPLEIASTFDDLEISFQNLKECELILIDTAGINHKNTKKIRELRSCLEKIKSVEVHLVLSATTQKKDLLNMVIGFSIIPINMIVFTKLDETDSFENILNLLMHRKIPVSYLTNGQQIPDDIISGSLKNLADLLIDRKKKEKNIYDIKPSLRKEKTLVNPEVVGSIEYFIGDIHNDVFHFPDCKKMENINLESILVFENIQEAIEKKFTPCQSCASVEVEAYYRSYVKDYKRVVGGYL